jgi:hypothetical protein
MQFSAAFIPRSRRPEARIPAPAARPRNAARGTECALVNTAPTPRRMPRPTCSPWKGTGGFSLDGSVRIDGLTPPSYRKRPKRH